MDPGKWQTSKKWRRTGSTAEQLLHEDSLQGGYKDGGKKKFSLRSLLRLHRAYYGTAGMQQENYMSTSRNLNFKD